MTHEAHTTTSHEDIRQWAEARHLAFLCQDETLDGGKSRFFKFVERN